MDRAEATGLGVAVAGHAVLLAALTLGLANAVNPPAIPQAMEVSFVEEVGLVSAAPQPSVEPPAQSIAPELGRPDEAAPAPLPEPAQPQPPRPAAKQAEPAPARRPITPSPVRPAPRPSETGERTRGSRLGPDLLKGLGRDPTPSRSQNPPAAAMSQRAAADIAQAIARQVQPCADRQVNPGPGAERIVTPIVLRLNLDGSLNGRPRVGRQRGLDDENRRYAERVADLAIRSFVECAPLRGLPQELYEVPRGWSNFTMNYRLPG